MSWFNIFKLFYEMQKEKDDKENTPFMLNSNYWSDYQLKKHGVL